MPIDIPMKEKLNSISFAYKGKKGKMTPKPVTTTNDAKHKAMRLLVGLNFSEFDT